VVTLRVVVRLVPAVSPAPRDGAVVLHRQGWLVRPYRDRDDRTRCRRLGNAPGRGFVPPTTGGLCTTTPPLASRRGEAPPACREGAPPTPPLLPLYTRHRHEEFTLSSLREGTPPLAVMPPTP